MIFSRPHIYPDSKFSSFVLDYSTWILTLNPHLEYLSRVLTWILILNPHLEFSSRVSTWILVLNPQLESSSWTLILNLHPECQLESSSWIFILNAHLESSSWLLILTFSMKRPLGIHIHPDPKFKDGQLGRLIPSCDPHRDWLVGGLCILGWGGGGKIISHKLISAS